MNTFLNSLSRCCDEYSQDADNEREKLRQIDERFKDLDKIVKKHLLEKKKQSNNLVQKNSCSYTPKNTLHKTFKSRPHSSIATQIIKREPVVRPAPYPVRNYILPVKPSINPQKYYNSHLKDAKRREMQMLEEEYSKYPGAFERNPFAKDELSMEVTATKLYNSEKVHATTIDMYFDNA